MASKVKKAAHYSDPDMESARQLNTVLRELRCLRCGRKMLTTRVHRICDECSAVNAVFGRYVEVSRLGKEELNALRSRFSISAEQKMEKPYEPTDIIQGRGENANGHDGGDVV